METTKTTTGGSLEATNTNQAILKILGWIFGTGFGSSLMLTYEFWIRYDQINWWSAGCAVVFLILGFILGDKKYKAKMAAREQEANQEN